MGQSLWEILNLTRLAFLFFGSLFIFLLVINFREIMAFVWSTVSGWCYLCHIGLKLYTNLDKSCIHHVSQYYIDILHHAFIKYCKFATPYFFFLLRYLVYCTNNWPCFGLMLQLTGVAMWLHNGQYYLVSI